LHYANALWASGATFETLGVGRGRALVTAADDQGMTPGPPLFSSRLQDAMGEPRRKLEAIYRLDGHLFPIMSSPRGVYGLTAGTKNRCSDPYAL